MVGENTHMPNLESPDPVYSAEGGHESDLASTPNGWVLGVVTMDDVDDRFVRNMDVDTEWEHAKALLYDDKTYEEWNQAFLTLRPRTPKPQQSELPLSTTLIQ